MYCWLDGSIKSPATTPSPPRPPSSSATNTNNCTPVQYSTAKIQQTNQKPKEGQTICVVIFSVHFYRRSFIGFFFSGMLTHTWAEIRKNEGKKRRVSELLRCEFVEMRMWIASCWDANVNNIKLGRALDAMIPIVAEEIYIF